MTPRRALNFDELHRERLPVTIADALNLEQAALWALELPAVSRIIDGRPDGFGIYPPQGAEPRVQLARPVTDLFTGTTIPAGSHGTLMVLWLSTRHELPVHRVAFAGEENPRVADVLPSAIGGVLALEGVVPQLTGWEVGRL